MTILAVIDNSPLWQYGKNQRLNHIFCPAIPYLWKESYPAPHVLRVLGLQEVEGVGSDEATTHLGGTRVGWQAGKDEANPSQNGV